MSGKSPRALVLLSGGLDSRLACKVLEEQLGRGNVRGVFFALPFGGGCSNSRASVAEFCRSQGYRLHVIDCTRGEMFRKYMRVIKCPRFQRGVGMNPCIDCHLFMLKEAKKLARKGGLDFLATGEVLGERPLSQNRQALSLIERKAGLEGRVLRPLSARLLPETLAEKRGWLDRTKLLDIQGRQRKRQIALARRYGISFPSPGGGCLLTEREFSKRMRNFLDIKTRMDLDDIMLLKMGRHFLKGRNIIIVGRREEENKELLKIAARKGLAYMEAREYMGPATIVLGRPGRGVLEAAAGLTARYSDAPQGSDIELVFRRGKAGKTLKAKAISKRMLEDLRA